MEDKLLKIENQSLKNTVKTLKEQIVNYIYLIKELSAEKGYKIKLQEKLKNLEEEYNNNFNKIIACIDKHGRNSKEHILLLRKEREINKEHEIINTKIKNIKC